jgi:hypothetical protein
MEDVVDSAAYSFPAEEEKILAWWDEVRKKEKKKTQPSIDRELGWGGAPPTALRSLIHSS